MRRDASRPVRDYEEVRSLGAHRQAFDSLQVPYFKAGTKQSHQGRDYAGLTSVCHTHDLLVPDTGPCGHSVAYVYVPVCVLVCGFVYMPVCACMCASVCVPVCVLMGVTLCVYLCMCLCGSLYVHACVCACVCVYLCVCLCKGRHTWNLGEVFLFAFS